MSCQTLGPLPYLTFCHEQNWIKDSTPLVRSRQRKSNRANLPKLAKESKEKFVRLGRSYVTYLFHAAQSNILLTSDIVKGLGPFELNIVFRAPLRQALYCFKQPFRSFQLCNYFQLDNESVCTEEILSFLGELRTQLDQPRMIITNAISFISRHDAIQSRPHLA